MSSALVLLLCVASLLCFACLEAQAQTSAGRARIAPSVVHLEPGDAQQFKVVMRATRLDGAKMAEDVTWAVNDIPGGDDTIGRITAEGLYTTPAKAPVPKEVHICADVPAAVNRSLWATVLIGAEGPEYELVGEWGESVAEPVHLKDPHCIAQDRDGNLIIADYNGSRVLRFTTDGEYLGDLGLGTGEAPGYVIKPRVVEVDRYGNIFVSDQKKDKPRIQVFSHEGEFLRIFAPKGTGPGQLLRAHGLAFDSLDRLFVVDVDVMRINVYSHGGEFLYTWGKDGPDRGDFNAPHGIAMDANNDVFVVGYYGPCQKFTPDGKLLRVFAEPDPPDGAVFFHSICSDRWGNVYMTVRGAAGYGGAVEDNEGNRVSVMKYNNNGDYVSSLTLSVKAHAENWAIVGRDGLVHSIYMGNERMGVQTFAPR
jgi:NHL repeat